MLDCILQSQATPPAQKITCTRSRSTSYTEYQPSQVASARGLSYRAVACLPWSDGDAHPRPRHRCRCTVLRTHSVHTVTSSHRTRRAVVATCSPKPWPEGSGVRQVVSHSLIEPGKRQSPRRSACSRCDFASQSRVRPAVCQEPSHNCIRIIRSTEYSVFWRMRRFLANHHLTINKSSWRMSTGVGLRTTAENSPSRSVSRENQDETE